MIRKELRDQIIAYNKSAAKRKEKASDMDTLMRLLGNPVSAGLLRQLARGLSN